MSEFFATIGAIMLVAALVAVFLAEQREFGSKSQSQCWLAFFVLIVFAAGFFNVSVATAAPLPKRCANLLPAMEAAYEGHPIKPAALAGQVMQESSCKRLARSPAGAVGLTQFTLPTIREMKARHNIHCDWRKIECALAMQTAYMKQLYNSKTPRQMETPCDRWATAAAAYNSGLGWQNRNRRATAKAGGNPRRYWREFDGIQKYHDKRWADWAAEENTHYPHYIRRHQMKFTRLGMKGEC